MASCVSMEVPSEERRSWERLLMDSVHKDPGFFSVPMIMLAAHHRTLGALQEVLALGQEVFLGTIGSREGTRRERTEHERRNGLDPSATTDESNFSACI